ncbi:hypothetical protein RSAG8_08150, partial [Rhizoctonia solani AG-8 WAC10335]
MKVSVISMLVLGASSTMALPFWGQQQDHGLVARNKAVGAGASNSTGNATQTLSSGASATASETAVLAPTGGADATKTGAVSATKTGAATRAQLRLPSLRLW